ncbi:MAG: hypothetical protein KBS81_02120 [Spirochaetales bacterium]|nr:hypothetical protein [Candidatus Physcosoma equi]
MKKEKPEIEKLIQAFENLDIDLLHSALTDGADINATDSYGCPCWADSMLFFKYALCCDYRNDEDVLKLWKADRERIMDFIRECCICGLDLNGWFWDDYPRNERVAFSITSFLEFMVDDIPFVDFLIECGFDATAHVEEGDWWLYSELRDELWHQNNEYYEGAIWLLKLCRHLMSRFPLLQQEFESLDDFKIKVSETKFLDYRDV